MARTNGPTAPPAPQWPTSQQAYGQPVQNQRGQPGTFANPGFGAPAGAPQPPQYAPQPAYSQQGQYAQPSDAYHYPEGSYATDTYSQPTLTAAPALPSHQHWDEPAAHSYAPRFEPYVPPAAPSSRAEPPPFSPPPFQSEPPIQHSREPRIVGPERGYSGTPDWQQPELRGPAYDQHAQWQPEPQFFPQDAAAPDANGQGYAAGYAQGYAPGQDYAAQGGWQQPDAYGAGQPAGYAGQQSYADPQGYGEAQGYDEQRSYGAPGYAPSQFAPQGYAQEQPSGYAPPAHAQSQALEREYDPDEVEYEDEEAGRGGRKMMIAAAVVGALGIAGALAYGYTSFFGGGATGGTPVVKSEGQPAKVKPLDPGGKKFAHTDSKILGRLNDGSSAPAADGSDAEGPRKVTTMVVGRDGSIVPAAAGAAPPPQAEAPAAVARPAGPVVVTPPQPSATPSVPGLTIVDGFGGRGGAAPVGTGAATLNGSSSSSASASAAKSAPAVTTTVPAAAASPLAPPVKAQVIARADSAPSTPPPKAAAFEPVKPAPKPAAEAVKPAAPKPKDTVAAIDSIRQDASRVSGDSGTSGAGYVAVLASVPASSSSRMDALKQFADLQQRYPAQLQSKSPEVQSANLADKGTYDRLIVGPPGSRQQASSLCAELKAVGYTSCWIKAY